MELTGMVWWVELEYCSPYFKLGITISHLKSPQISIWRARRQRPLRRTFPWCFTDGKLETSNFDGPRYRISLGYGLWGHVLWCSGRAEWWYDEMKWGSEFPTNKSRNRAFHPSFWPWLPYWFKPMGSRYNLTVVGRWREHENLFWWYNKSVSIGLNVR